MKVGNLVSSGVVLAQIGLNLISLSNQGILVGNQSSNTISVQAVHDILIASQAISIQLGNDSGLVGSSVSESGGCKDTSHHNTQQNGNELLEVVHWFFPPFLERCIKNYVSIRHTYGKRSLSNIVKKL